MLPLETFKTIVASTPLVSIDLIVRNLQYEILLGKRTNRPAKGYWFVPGGRVLKDESLEKAILRLTNAELNVASSRANFKGVYQHFYDDNFSVDDFTTHYIVLAYEMFLDEDLLSLPVEQHSEYHWFTENQLLTNQEVHEHTKWYFQENR
jgi:colanic acid biosynthesis protein WcaH